MRTLIPVALPLLALLVNTTATADFEAQLQERLALYEEARSDPAGLSDALAGRFERQHQKLEAVVPDSEKTAIDHLLVGNMLYAVDPERSFAHHQAALASHPDEPLVWIEIAYQHHRRGSCDQALPFYERLATRRRLEPPQYALMAHCLLDAGRHAEAIDAWRRTEHPKRHAAVDFTIHDVFGEVSPLARHDRLVKRVRAGDESAVWELLDNAVTWQRDWWNTAPNWQAFDAAVEVVQQQFSGDRDLIREIRVWRESLASEGPEELAALLRKHDLILDEGALPQSSFIARKLLTEVAQRGLAEVPALATRFIGEIEKRARGTQPDPEALILLGVFVAETGDRDALREVDRYGWQRYHNADFALSLILGRADELRRDFKHDDTILRKAIAEFPDDPRFSRIAVNVAVEAGAATPELLAQLIQAEYHGLRSDDSRYSYALMSYYTALANRLPDTLPASAGD